jgi:hypothetical protein
MEAVAVAVVMVEVMALPVTGRVAMVALMVPMAAVLGVTLKDRTTITHRQGVVVVVRAGPVRMGQSHHPLAIPSMGVTAGRV